MHLITSMDGDMLKRKVCFVFLCTSLFSVSSFAHSYDSMQFHPVLTLTGGVANTQLKLSNDYILGESRYRYRSSGTNFHKEMFGISVGAEYRCDPRYNLQAGIGFYQPTVFIGKGHVTQGIDEETVDTFDYRYRVLTKQLIVEGKLLANMCNCYHPYVAGGLGVAFNNVHSYNVNIEPDWITLSPQYTRHSSRSFTYNIGFGLDVDVTRNLRIGAGYRYAHLGNLKLGSGIINTTTVTKTLSQSRLHAQEIFAQLSLVFC